MKRTLFCVLASCFALLLCLTGCGAGDDTVTFRLVCRSEDIYQIFYTCYIDGEYFCMGGLADLDGNTLTEDSDLTFSFPESYFEGADISKISFTFSPYGKDDTSEIATTERLSIPAEYGKTYTIYFSGDQENGFTAELAN
ncbi:MAG: hypothetical protein IJ049_01980 [Oscillospiraceae bacterium]|nr:hypothetical protein [Oscillospiraceae bacterium]